MSNEEINNSLLRYFYISRYLVAICFDSSYELSLEYEYDFIPAHSCYHLVEFACTKNIFLSNMTGCVSFICKI